MARGALVTAGPSAYLPACARARGCGAGLSSGESVNTQKPLRGTSDATSHLPLSAHAVGGFGTPVTVGLALQYQDIPKVTSLTMNNAGQAVMAYDIQGNFGMGATRSASGSWSVSRLACSFTGDPAIDGAGDALILCEGTNAEGGVAYDATRLTAGGTWGTPVVLTSDEILSSSAAADAAGTFVVTLGDFTAGAATVFTSPPGGSLGMPATFSGFGVADLTMAATVRPGAGHAAAPPPCLVLALRGGW